MGFDESELSIKILLRVLSSTTSTTLRDLAIMSSSYCCVVMLSSCMYLWMEASYLAIA